MIYDDEDWLNWLNKQMDQAESYHQQLKEHRMDDTYPENDERRQELAQARTERRINVLAPKQVELLGKLLTEHSQLEHITKNARNAEPVTIVILGQALLHNFEFFELEELIYARKRQIEIQLQIYGLEFATPRKPDPDTEPL